MKTLLSLCVVAVIIWLWYHPPKLAQHWVYLSGSKKGKPMDMELFKDGTGICDGASISWKVEDERFVLLSPLFALASYYEKFDFDRGLVLFYDDGDSTVFVNKAYYKTYYKKLVEAEERKEKYEKLPLP